MVKGVRTLRDARVIFKNFSGKEGKYNREGDRNFCVILDPETARCFTEEKWNVKWTKPAEGSDYESVPYIQVKISYKKSNPTIVLIAAINDEPLSRKNLDEKDLDILDYTYITKADIMISPYNYEVGGKTGVTAYLKSLYVTFEVDPLEMEYSDIPDTAITATMRND